jgi:hypothetical protein
MSSRLLLCLAVVAVTPAALYAQAGSAGEPLASRAEVQSIVAEIKLLPTVRRIGVAADPSLKDPGTLAYPAKALREYKLDDYKTIDELRKRYKEDPKVFAQKHPVRASIFDAIDALRKCDKMALRDSLNAPLDVKAKAAFLKQQAEPGKLILELEEALSDMKRVADKDLPSKESKRWQANFAYTMTRLKAQVVYLYEYDYLLGQIRQDNLPPLKKGASGWQLIPRAKIQVNESVAKKYAKELAVAWSDLQKDHPDTPWAVMAQRDSQVPLGLEWLAKME